MQNDYKSIWKMSYPLMISLLIQQLIGITDVIYLGRLSEVALGASALGSTYFFTIFILAFGFSTGAQIIMARRNGEKNYSKIGEVFYQSCSFLFFMAIGIIVLSKFFTPSFLRLIISDKEIYEAVLEYVDWRIWGLICASIVILIRSFFVSITNTAILTLISGVMFCSNIVLNYLLIFGHCGFPRMGIGGAALASDLSELITLMICIVYFWRKVDLKKYGLLHFIFLKWQLLCSILRVSAWTMLQQFLSIFTWFLFFVAIEHLGKQELAISNILKSTASLPYVVINSFGAVASSLTANLIGQKKSEEVFSTCYRIIKLCSAIVLPILLLMVIGVYPILRIYTNNQSLIPMAVSPYMVMIGSFLTLIPGWVLFSTVSGTGNTRPAFIIEIAAMLFYVIHIVTVIVWLRMPLSVCLLADCVYNTCILILSAIYLYSGKWKGKKV